MKPLKDTKPKESQLDLVSRHCPEEMKCLFFMDVVTSIKYIYFKKPTNEFKMLKPIFSQGPPHDLEEIYFFTVFRRTLPAAGTPSHLTSVHLHSEICEVYTGQDSQCVDYTLRNS